MLAENIKNLRRIKKISQDKLGQLLSVTQQAVCKWEKGVAEPDSATLAAMCEMFGVSLDYLIGRTNDQLKLQPTIDSVEYSIPSNLDPRLLDGFARHDIKLSDLASLNDEQIALIVAMTQNLIDRHKK